MKNDSKYYSVKLNAKQIMNTEISRPINFNRLPTCPNRVKQMYQFGIIKRLDSEQLQHQ